MSPSPLPSLASNAFDTTNNLLLDQFHTKYARKVYNIDYELCFAFFSWSSYLSFDVLVVVTSENTMT